MTRSNTYLDAADRSLREAYEEPMGIDEYVETAFETPTIASQAPKYLLEAIESMGTREVFEEGERRERYRFFDDPHNDGEHAILGNTDVLNGFVDDLRIMAAEEGTSRDIVWFAGPTATGKSELKRCLINGLHAYSKTPAGRRYTLEWNIEGTGETRGLSYSDQPASDEDDWHESPVQINPLAVFPRSVREDLLADLNDRGSDEIDLTVRTDLDPFSQEAYDHLEETYRRQNASDLFSAVTDERHLRVKNYIVDVGQGIGVLQAEDGGSPTERLVGGWMPELLQELDSRGRKNPQAFSYDGVLSQGNTGVTIIEDASQHLDLVQRMLSVPEEGAVKLDRGIGMDVDTLLIMISNPDLTAQLNQHEERTNQDPLKALKRRLDKREFRYLTNLSLEVQLLRRELAGEHGIWEADDYDALDARIREPVTVTVRDTAGDRREREFAPHTVEAAALYEVVTRFDTNNSPTNLDLIDRAMLADRGYIEEGDQRRQASEFEFDSDVRDGAHGIPVTYTCNILSACLRAEYDRTDPDLDVEDVVLPMDVLDAMADGLADAPVFAASERGEYENRVIPVKDYIQTRQEADVLDAMLAAHRPDEETVAEYVEHVYAWATDESIETDRGDEVPPDPLTMKIFEIEHLGRFDEEDYNGTDATDSVASFRREHVLTALNRHAWESRGDGFEVEDIDITDLPVIGEVLAEDDWEDVRRIFEELNPRQWDDPPAGTETERVKRETVQRLQEGEYSPAAAELTSRRVLKRVSHRWD